MACVADRRSNEKRSKKVNEKIISSKRTKGGVKMGVRGDKRGVKGCTKMTVNKDIQMCISLQQAQ